MGSGRGMIRLIIALPFLIVLVLFALSNTTLVQLTLWPTGVLIMVPLSIAVLVGMAIAFLLGALFMWVSALGQRRRARRAEYMVRQLEEQVQTLHARAAAPAVPPPG